MPAIRVLIDYIAEIMTEADAIIAKGDGERNRLQPLRLRMAATITSFQLALDSRLLALEAKGDTQTPALRRAAVEWAALANEYRDFASRNLSTEPPDWNEYVTHAQEFMVRFDRQIRYIRTMLPILDDHTLAD